jgi:hypothetical protein
MMKKWLAAIPLRIPRRLYASLTLVPLLVGPFTASAAQAGLWNTLQANITAKDGGYLTKSLALGDEIFATIFVAFVVIGLCWATLTNNFDEFGWGLGRVIFKMVPPLAAINFAHLILPILKTVVNFFVGHITGIEGAGGADALVALGTTTSLSLIHNSTAPLSDPVGMLGVLANPGNLGLAFFNSALAAIAAVVIKLAFIWVACELVFAWYQVLLGSSVGAAQVGFFGSDVTSDMAFRYTGGVVAGMWKIVLLNIWPYTVSAVFLSFNFAADLAHPGTFVQAVIGLIVFGIIVIIGTFRVNRMAETMFSGQPSYSFAEMAKVIANAAAGAVKAAGAKGAPASA